MKKEVEQALNMVKQVCANIQANLEAHNAIQAAISVIEDALIEENPSDK